MNNEFDIDDYVLEGTPTPDPAAFIENLDNPRAKPTPPPEGFDFTEPSKTVHEGGYDVEDFMDTTVAPNKMDNRLREYALQVAYTNHPGLEQLVTGAHQMDTGTKEFAVAALGWGASVALEKYSAPLSIAAGIFGIGLFGKGSWDYASGAGKVQQAAEILKNDPEVQDLLRNSKAVTASGVGEGLGFFGTMAAASMLNLRQPWRAGIPIAVGLIGSEVAHIQGENFNDNLDELLEDELGM